MEPKMYLLYTMILVTYVFLLGVIFKFLLT